MLLRLIHEAVGRQQRKRKAKTVRRKQSTKGTRTNNTIYTATAASAATANASEQNYHATSQQPLAYALARSWAWPALSFRCQIYPEEISNIIQDERGETILHWTCLGKPPFETVQAILHVAPEMTRRYNVAGELPLHVAITYRASVEVIRLLMEVFPESAGLPNRQGATPLHLLCDCGSSVDSMRAILETPAGASTIQHQWKIHYQDHDNHNTHNSSKNKFSTTTTTALQLLHRRMNAPHFRRDLLSMRETRKRQQTIHEELNRLLQKEKELNTKKHDHENDRNQQQQQQQQQQLVHEQTHESATQSTSSTSITNTTTFRQAKANLARHELMIASFQQNDYWQKAAMLILVEYTQQPLPPEGLHDKQANIVHACAGVSSCHANLLEFAMLLHQNDLQNQRDDKGRLPLHIAAMHHAKSLTSNDNDSSSSSFSQSRSESHLLQILEACPTAALVKDDDGNLPLASALQNLRTNVWSTGLQTLMDANISALETLNLDEKLYPLLLKRMTGPNEVFRCLHLHPHLFRNMNRRNVHEVEC